MLKKGDVNNDADDDDEVRTSGLQNCVTVTLSTKAFLLRTQYLLLSSHISREVWGARGDRKWTINTILRDGFSWGHSSQPVR
jgi:hypothetical protein